MRPFETLLVWGRDGDKASSCAREMGEKLGVTAEAVADPAELVARAQLVVTTTPAREPILKADWLHPGLHVTAMGSDADYKNEIDAAALARADLYVCDRVSQCAALGELRAAQAACLWSGGTPPELGALVSGAHPGRRSDAQITICDLTGTGAQDTAIATHVHAILGQAGTLISA